MIIVCEDLSSRLDCCVTCHTDACRGNGDLERPQLQDGGTCVHVCCVMAAWLWTDQGKQALAEALAQKRARL